MATLKRTFFSNSEMSKEGTSVSVCQSTVRAVDHDRPSVMIRFKLLFCDFALCLSYDLFNLI